MFLNASESLQMTRYAPESKVILGEISNIWSSLSSLIIQLEISIIDSELL